MELGDRVGNEDSKLPKASGQKLTVQGGTQNGSVGVASSDPEPQMSELLLLE